MMMSWQYDDVMAVCLGLPAVEPSGRHAGERGPQRGGGGSVHQSSGAAARIHPVQIQPGDQLHQPGSSQVTPGAEP